MGKDERAVIPRLLKMPFAYAITLLYVTIAGLWIYFSDRFIVLLARTPEQLLVLSTSKGWFFVAFTALLLFFTLKRFTTGIEHSSNRLRSSMERYRITLQAIGDAVIATDATGRIEFINPIAENLTGWTATEAVGRPMQEVLHIINEKTREKVEDPVAMVLQKGRIVGLTNHTLLIARNGVERPITDSVAPIRDQKGAITGGVLVFHDQSEERRKNEILLDNNERMQKIMDSIDALIYIADMETFELLFVNEYGRRTWGADIIGKKCWKVLQGGERPCPFCSNDRLLNSDGTPAGVYHWEFQNKVNGRWYDIRDSAITWTDGHLVRLEVATDITERKWADEALLANERNLREAQTIAHVGSWRIDLNSGTVTGSDEAHRIYGLEKVDWTIATIQAIPLPQYRKPLDAALHNLVSKGIPYDIEFQICRHSDKALRHIHSVAEYDADHNAIIGAIHDITERKEAEEALRANEAFLNGIMSSIQDGISVLNPDLTIRYTNHIMETWYAERMPLRGQKCHACYHLSDSPCTPCPTIRCLQSGQVETEIVPGPRGSSVQWLELYCYPMLNPETGEVAGVIEYTHDISERLKLEGQLRQAQKMESVGRLAGGVAHDFNNMLSVILGYTELALENVASDTIVHGQLTAIHNAALRSADITRQLLAFARKQTIAPQVLSLNETVAGMLTIIQRLIGEDIDLVWSPKADLWPVKMDPAQINQILANLCINARDAITGTGKITIETDSVHLDEAYCADHLGFHPGDFVLLAVSDNGCGMNGETKEKLFEPFFTTKDVDKGTGLGLAMVYGIIKQNNGFINVYSEPGKGTTLRIYLPRHRGEAQTVEGGRDQQIQYGEGETVIIVEDETVIIELGKLMLERLHYRVLTASTPAEAIQMAAAFPETVDLLLTDVVMPEMNGRDLATEMMKYYPRIKTVFMSGYTANVIAHHGVLDAGVHFLQKPFSMQDLAAIIDTALKKP